MPADSLLGRQETSRRHECCIAQETTPVAQARDQESTLQAWQQRRPFTGEDRMHLVISGDAITIAGADTGKGGRLDSTKASDFIGHQ
jgi:hypothetical protein